MLSSYAAVLPSVEEAGGGPGPNIFNLDRKSPRLEWRQGTERRTRRRRRLRRIGDLWLSDGGGSTTSTTTAPGEEST